MTKSLIAAKLSLVICLVVLIPILTASPVCGFQAGANGADGVDGDPGTDGEDGENGSDVLAGNAVFGASVAIGNAGGNGGNGGNGIDDDDADSSAAGGNSGSGGQGGKATAQDDSWTFARGGNGGSGGLFGRGTSRLLNGFGGNGGDGGDAFAFSTKGFSSTTSEAVGGTGGNAYGSNAFAGNGGGAFVKGMTPVGSLPSFRGVDATKFGGNGGIGFIEATGGNGASISFGVDDEFEFDNPIFTGFHRVEFSGRAGSGGDSENGVAGNAGHALIDLAGIKQQLWYATPEYRRTELELYGGYGGRGIATGNQLVSGQNGGHATLSGETTFENSRRNDFVINLRGGNGGSALGSRNAGTGGDGGQATMDAITLVSTLDDFTIGTVRATIKGGDGGHANGTGRAGRGASVDLSNKFSIIANHAGILDLTADGGDGGWGKGNGHGGAATIETLDAISQTTEHSGFVNGVILRANGGNAGLGVVGQLAAQGGDASASSIERTVNRLSIDVQAVGGIGNLGKSGDSLARAHAMTTGSGEINEFRAFANALADSRRISDFDRVLPSIGTSSTSDAMATSNSASQAFARSRAVGGWGFLESGSADSTAHAENKSTGEAIAVASSFSHGDRSPVTENFSTSHAHAKSISGPSEATAVAAGTGHFSRVHATAGIDASQGFAHTETKSSTISWNHSANITNNIDFVATNGTASLVDSSSYFGFRQTGFADTTGVESSVDLLLIPDRTFADSVISPGITDVIDEDADVLGLGRIGGGFAGDPFDGRLEINSAIDMSLRLQPFHDDKNLILGLFGVESTGEGFEDLSFSVTHMGQSLIDESFTSLADATVFFDDHLFNLGELNNEETLIDFQFDFSMNVEDPLDSFKFDFVFGNADPRMGAPSPFTLGGGNGGLSSVPEPASGIVIGLTLLGLVHRRRRQSF